MPTILLSWLGQTDLNASRGEESAGLGPVANALEARSFDRVVLLINYALDRGEEYQRWVSEQPWMREKGEMRVDVRYCPLKSPVNYREIYQAVSGVAEEVAGTAGRDTAGRDTAGRGVRLVFHLSPGTPAMTAVWLLLAKTRYSESSEIIQTSRQRGVETVDFPFDLYAEFVPELLRRSDDELVRWTQGLPPSTSEFTSIVHRCAPMKQALALARRLATRELPVLVLGESGTGKELLARAIHSASSRRRRAFVPVNCGAIPPELVDSELFGHRKGAFTGAIDDRKGVFEEATGGTLFLDEIGELSKPAQVRLLRALQEGTIRRVGEAYERQVDVRVIAATHRDLLAEVAEDRFREDLFHRVAIGLIHLPPLRQREGDLNLLIDFLMEEINREASRTQPGYVAKRISTGARAVLLRQSWPGNVRELRNVLLRASVWAVSETIIEEDMRLSLLPQAAGRQDDVLGHALGNGFELSALLDDVKRSYIERALTEAHGKKKQAAELLGLGSYQLLNQWMARLGIEQQ